MPRPSSSAPLSAPPGPLATARAWPLLALAVALLVGSGLPGEARAFCGFFVAKADASLYNEASQVALVRDGDRTVVSMLNDFKGELTEFALVVPVPTILATAVPSR